MQIIGFSIHKLSAERKSQVKGKINIKNNLNIEDINTEIVPLSKEPALKFDFIYDVVYEPDVAKLELKGSVLGLDEKGDSKEILKSWKDKKFESPIKLSLFNFIMGKCSLKALELEDQLGLPLHIPFPKIKSRPAGPANYTG